MDILVVESVSRRRTYSRHTHPFNVRSVHVVISVPPDLFSRADNSTRPTIDRPP